MTLAELNRLLDSKRRMNKAQEQKQASFDYILADLIGRSISRMYNAANKMPRIDEAYPTLFNSKELEEKEQQNKDNLSALRFKLFAQSYNERLKGVSKEL